jgi:hypothetical protein
MSTPFNFFGDLAGASSYLNEADKKLNLLCEGCSVCLTDEDIEQLENQFRVIRSQLSKLKDRKDKFKALTILRSENSK